MFGMHRSTHLKTASNATQGAVHLVRQRHIAQRRWSPKTQVTPDYKVGRSSRRQGEHVAARKQLARSQTERSDNGAGHRREFHHQRLTPVTVTLAASAPYTAPIGLRLWRISGDGRCMFRALVQGAHQLDHG